MNHPRAINLRPIRLANSPTDTAYEWLTNFGFYRKRIPGYPGVIRDLQLIQDTVNDAMTDVVADMRAAGISWNEIGEALGVSRQAARQRFGGRGIS